MGICNYTKFFSKQKLWGGSNNNSDVHLTARFPRDYLTRSQKEAVLLKATLLLPRGEQPSVLQGMDAGMRRR
jgi:hypothetical protein